MAALPPVEVRPERLFRLLSATPRPRLPIAHRVRGAHEHALEVCGLRGSEHAAIHDAAAGLQGEARDSRVSAGLVAASLYADGEPAFADADGVGLLLDPDAVALGTAVVAALAVCSPILSRCVVAAWHNRLREGAQHYSNIYTAIAMHDCSDVAVGFGGAVHMARPDRYYGMPVSHLTDGQLLAYRAAFSVVEAMRKHG